MEFFSRQIIFNPAVNLKELKYARFVQKSSRGSLQIVKSGNALEILSSLPPLHDLAKTLQTAANHTAIAVAGLRPGAGEIEILDRRGMRQTLRAGVVERLIPAANGAAIVVEL
jgi:hypothetical protein